MKWLLFLMVALFPVSNCWSVTLDQDNSKCLYDFYAEENIADRANISLESVVKEILPQLDKGVLNGKMKRRIIYETLKAYHDKDSIPIICFPMKRYMLQSKVLQEMMSIVKEVYALWPKDNNWTEIIVDLRLKKPTPKDVVALEKVFSSPQYNCYLEQSDLVPDTPGDGSYLPPSNLNKSFHPPRLRILILEIFPSNDSQQ